MAKNNKTNQAQDPEAVIEQGLGRFELFLAKNGKLLLTILGVIIVAVGIYFAVKHLYTEPRKEKASAAMYEAQYEFERDSFALALHGNQLFDGFLAVAEDFKGTPQANIARHYAGICYLYLGQYQDAIDALKSFKPVKGAAGEIISAQNLGLTGDAYVELGQLEEGLKMYEKAVSHSDNMDTAPAYLKKAGMLNESLGNKQKALQQYETIRDNYPGSLQARDIEKFIAHVQQSL